MIGGKKKMVYLWIDGPAGEYEYTNRPEAPGPHFNLAGEFKTIKAAREEVGRIIAESTVYVVFFDDTANTGFVSEESDLSGNWRGSRDYPFRCVAEFDTEAEAEDYLKSLIR
jgi:hypothetical protein